MFLILAIKIRKQHGFKEEHNPFLSLSGATASTTSFLPVPVHAKSGTWSGPGQSKTLAWTEVAVELSKFHRGHR